ncbi:DUF554 domain-containing protein [Tessaracoccus sp. OS52]|uniref:DUF554 domain-containing protein n=1 Tax=Tessaracoccus sp. OS52 TaxID=2886691 RepID=UPI001D0F96CD|nr:DUF554 domain-containing protein [Tessaracoccus sp. OS52]MCC2592358.1 DUF554 domain-containing protein [Tessaracoccus sp. OS52]
MFIGMGTVVNTVAVVVGATLGLLIGNRLPERSRSLVVDTLGLVTIVLGVFAATSMNSDAINDAVGSGAGMLLVLGALLPGALIGSALRLEDRLDSGARWVARRFGREDGLHFVEGIVTPTLVFCVGPLTILGSISDGLGLGAQQLMVKSVMDGFASIAFAASLGIGVLFSAGAVAVLQGSLTLAAFALGGFLDAAQIDVLNATGGIILIGLGIRLLDLKAVRVADLLPALALAPVVTWAVAQIVARAA